MADIHFARVEPIVGASLRRTRVALLGLPIAAPIVAYLAACGVGCWLWATTDHRPLTTDGASGGPSDFFDQHALRSYLLAQHGPALSLDTAMLPPAEWAAAIRRDPPDLAIAVGGPAEHALALETAAAARIPALLIVLPSDASSCQAIIFFPDDDIAVVRSYLSIADEVKSKIQNLKSKIVAWDWLTCAPLCAGLARAILLRDTPFRRADLANLWASGIRVMTLGGVSPLDVVWSLPHQSAILRLRSGQVCNLQSAIFQTPPTRRGALLIAGLGSLGSIAAMHLARCADTLVIADPDHVDAYNPVRQAYSLVAIGRPKAQALRDGLLAAGASEVVALATALIDERSVAALVERHAITAALVATGTNADFAIARALRAGGVPHVVGRCYPRGRYWEAIVVDGQHGPALDDVRGHLRAGPAPTPTPEQIAAYSDAGALEAEPATLVESGWAAAWMARLIAQMLAPAGLRERWLLELLAAGRTCLVGGVGVERTPDGPAYAVTQPAEIHAWGRDSIRETKR
jgi:ThiF family